MIIWLASYPKSGNTWVRSFLNSLLFNKNNEANLNEISKIDQYPKRSHFINLVNEIDNLEKLSLNWIESQKLINCKIIKLNFLKTHPCSLQIPELIFYKWRGITWNYSHCKRSKKCNIIYTLSFFKKKL